MMCVTCLSFAGDNDDFIIKYLTGHHPRCPDFSINKHFFIEEFKRQTRIATQKEIESKLPIFIKEETSITEKEVSSLKIIKKLYWNLYKRYFPIAPNIYFYNWESDLLAVNKESKYITEYEVKISRGDFKADFKKFDKHQLISDCYQYNFSSDIPNYFCYVTPPGLLDKSQIPFYAGLIEVGIGHRVVKKAPLIHKIELTKIQIDNILRKVYNKYWS